MKSIKLIDILKDGNIVIPLYLMKNYKEFNLKIDEFIFMIYLYNLGDRCIFNPLKYSEDLGLNNSDILGYIDVLCEKKLIKLDSFKNDKGFVEDIIVLEGFYKKMSNLVIENINYFDSASSNVFEIIEKEFGRTLSPIEFEIIKAWLDNNISEELILAALKEAIFNGVSNLRYIDKILYEWGKAGVKNIEDVNKRKMKRQEEMDKNIDPEIVEWSWFDEDGE